MSPPSPFSAAASSSRRAWPTSPEGRRRSSSLLVSIGAPRLRALGLDVPLPFEDAQERLYLLLARDDPKGAHSRYNGLVRRLVSYERAVESAR